jgi:FkbM family methyltransferase
MPSSLSNLLAAPYNKEHKLFAFSRFAYWKLIRLLKLKNIRYNLWEDRKIFLNYDSFQSMWIMYNYIVDWEEFHLISKVVQPADQVFDIGANMGFYTLWMSKFIKNGGKIHSFEPDSGNYERLNKNIGLNRIESLVKPHLMALGDEDKDLFFTTGLDGRNHIAGESESKVVRVKGQRLDTYARQENIKEIRYAKIDVEGFEYMVLKGANELLSGKRIEILQLEINGEISNSGVGVEDLLNLITQSGYQLCRYDTALNSLLPIAFSPARENYFAVADLQKVNQKLSTLPA